MKAVYCQKRDETIVTYRSQSGFDQVPLFSFSLAGRKFRGLQVSKTLLCKRVATPILLQKRPAWEETSQTHPCLVLMIKKEGFGEFRPRASVGGSPFAKQCASAGRGIHPVLKVHALWRRFGMNNAGGVNTPPGTRLQCLRMRKK